MIQDIYPQIFHNEYERRQPDEDAKVLIYRDRKCLLRQKTREGIVFPTAGDCGEALDYVYLFRIDDEEYYLGRAADAHALDPLLRAKYDWEDIRLFRAAEPRDRCFAGVTGFQIALWYARHRYCGACGELLQEDEYERMMRCPACGELYYPQICPAVIIGVTHRGKLLMSRYRDRSYSRFALLAGFNETGESIEQTVHREVMEEVGLRVKNLRFYRSQPWSFSDTLLMGFFCELDGSDDSILLDGNELLEAGWYRPDQIPEDEEHASLTSEMMTVFRDYDGILPDTFDDLLNR